jgi:hypothetical protein
MVHSTCGKANRPTSRLEYGAIGKVVHATMSSLLETCWIEFLTATQLLFVKRRYSTNVCVECTSKAASFLAIDNLQILRLSFCLSHSSTPQHTASTVDPYFSSTYSTTTALRKYSHYTTHVLQCMSTRGRLASTALITRHSSPQGLSPGLLVTNERHFRVVSMCSTLEGSR